MWGGTSDKPSTFGANYSIVVPTRTPLSLLTHSSITQETDTLSRLQKDYSSHPQEFSVENSKVIKCKEHGYLNEFPSQLYIYIILYIWMKVKCYFAFFLEQHPALPFRPIHRALPTLQRLPISNTICRDEHHSQQ